MMHQRTVSSFAVGHFDIVKNALPSSTSASCSPSHISVGPSVFLCKSFDAEMCLSELGLNVSCGDLAERQVP